MLVKLNVRNYRLLRLSSYIYASRKSIFESCVHTGDTVVLHHTRLAPSYSHSRLSFGVPKPRDRG